MVFFNHATRQMTVKIVYYGPGLCGKTTNLNTIYARTTPKARGEMVSLNTETDRTLFFDLLPMDVGMVGGFKTRLQLYTVPGQVFYNSTRKLVLKGLDGIVFVVDSQSALQDACHASFLNLQDNLRELGLNHEDIPTVFQWNKRDLRNVLSLEDLEATLNPGRLPSFRAVASEGQGVFETLRGITRLALSRIKSHLLDEDPSAGVPAVQPLALTDLPSDLDLLDLEGAFPGGSGEFLLLPEEGLFGDLPIEAPVLPELPGVVSEDLTFLLESDLTSLPETDPEPSAPTGSAWEPSPGLGGGSTATLEMAVPVLAPAPLHQEVEDPELQHAQVSAPSPVDPILASPLVLVLPADLGAPDLEVVVQVRQRGRVLLEGQLRCLAPSPGATDRLSIDLTRP